MRLRSSLLPVLLVGLCGSGCRDLDGAARSAFVFSSDASSRTGLLETPEGVILGNEAGRLILLRPEGQVGWTVQLGREVAARPALSGDGLVVAATLAGDWFGIELKTGKVVWQSPMSAPVRSPLLADEGRVYGTLPSGEVRAVWAADGTLAWNQPPILGTVAGDRPARSAVLLWTQRPDEQLLVVVQPGLGLWALNPDTGNPQWKRGDRELSGASSAPNALYVTTAAGRVRSLRAADGKPSWTREVGPASGPPSIALGQVWIPLEARQLIGLNPVTGEEQQRLPVPGRVVAPIAASSQTLWIPTEGNDGALWGMRPSDGRRSGVRIDSPLRTEPVVREGTVLALSSDGRVTAVQLEGERAISKQPPAAPPPAVRPPVSVSSVETAATED